jgi:hypothetical protein
MSIYCSTFDLGIERLPKCKRIRKIRRNVYEQDESKPCTCGSCPIEYQGRILIHLTQTNLCVRIVLGVGYEHPRSLNKVRN